MGLKLHILKRIEISKNYRITSLIISKKNNGRIKARQLLSEQSKYDWLLFMDADTLPKHNTFITAYLNDLQNYEAQFGGIYYDREKPPKDQMLRWKYGIKKEEVSAINRLKAPYKHIVSANMIITKALFNTIHFGIEFDGYGMDSYFGVKLKELNAKINHIDNEVYHLGIESSSDYLKKKEQATITLLKLIDENKITIHENHLLRLFKFLKRYKLNYIFSGIYIVFNPLIKANLLGANPIIELLQLYRISYMCFMDLNK